MDDVDAAPESRVLESFHPQMRLSHSTVRWNDADGHTFTHNRSILSIVWWEESQYALARYAPIFLDEENFDLSNVRRLRPAAPRRATGPPLTTTFRRRRISSRRFTRMDAAARSSPASRTSIEKERRHPHHVPDRPRNAGRGNITWMRRHIPIVGVVGESPLAPTAPVRVSSMGRRSGRPTGRRSTGATVTGSSIPATTAGSGRP